MAEQDLVAAARAVAALFREQRFYWLSRGWDEVQELLRATEGTQTAQSSAAQPAPVGNEALTPEHDDARAATPTPEQP